MENSIDLDLAALLKQQAKINPAAVWSFIVTVTPGANTSLLAQNGFEVENTFETISASSGKMTAAQALALGALDQVVRVEFDGEVRALKSPKSLKTPRAKTKR